MELSPVIAPLSQAFIKCERGWLLWAFHTWNTDNFLPPEEISRPFYELHSTLQAVPKPLWRTSYKFWWRACLTSACFTSHSPIDRGRPRQTGRRNGFNSSKLNTASHFVTSKSMSNQVHPHSWLQYEKQNKKGKSISEKSWVLLPTELLLLCFCFSEGGVFLF